MNVYVYVYMYPPSLPASPRRAAGRQCRRVSGGRRQCRYPHPPPRPRPWQAAARTAQKTPTPCWPSQACPPSYPGNHSRRPRSRRRQLSPRLLPAARPSAPGTPRGPPRTKQWRRPAAAGCWRGRRRCHGPEPFAPFPPASRGPSAPCRTPAVRQRDVQREREPGGRDKMSGGPKEGMDPTVCTVAPRTP